MKVPERRRVIKVAVLLATGANTDGYREILGPQRRLQNAVAIV